MPDDKVHELELKTLTHGIKIDQIVERMDSYHNDSRQRHDKLEEMVAKLPDEDKIYRMFSAEAEKLVKGLIKRGDEQQEQIDGLKDNQKYVAGFGAGVAGILSVIWNVFHK